jgi:hypothetical protein
MILKKHMETPAYFVQNDQKWKMSAIAQAHIAPFVRSVEQFMGGWQGKQSHRSAVAKPGNDAPTSWAARAAWRFGMP